MVTSNMGHHIRFDEQLVFERKIPEQRKPKGEFAQLPEMPGNPFFERIDMDEGGHVYQAKQRCWYSLTTIIGPMEGGDYLPTAVRGELPEPNRRDSRNRPIQRNLVDEEPQTAHAWKHFDDGWWQPGGHHLHHWYGGEIAKGACIYIGAAPWNPDTVLIPESDIILSAGVGDILSAVIERLNLLLEVASGEMQRLFGREAGTNALDAIRLVTIDNNGDHVGIVFGDDGRIARFERVQLN